MTFVSWVGAALGRPFCNILSKHRASHASHTPGRRIQSPPSSAWSYPVPVPAPASSQRADPPHKAALGVPPQHAVLPLAARIDRTPPRRALLLARCLGSDHATATGVADRDVLEAPRVRNSPARRTTDRFVVCSTRLETHAGEGRRVDRSDGGCAPSLGPVAFDQPTTPDAAETVVRPHHCQLQVDEVSWCCPAARLSSPRRNAGTPCKSRTHLRSPEKQSAHWP